MNSLKNRVQLIGNLGADPEVTTFENNRKLATLRLATNEEYYDKAGKKVTDTQWHSLKVWGKLADICEKYLAKGREIAVEGKLTHEAWTDKEGNKRYSTHVVVNELLMMGAKQAS